MQVIQPQPTKENPYIVDDYPYGYRLRTQVRYWIETSGRYGQRLVFQSLNPKNGRWNNPKPSGYSQIVLAGLDEKGHVTSAGISFAYRTAEEAKKFSEKYGSFLSESQQKELANITEMLNFVEKNVTWEIRTRKYKNVLTGEIVTSIPIMEMNDYIEVNDLGDPVDKKAEKDIDRDLNRMVNIGMIKAASTATSKDSAYQTFKRSG